MSGIGVLADPTEAKPQLPNTVAVKGSTSGVPTPDQTGAVPSNVTGGTATFSSMTDTVGELLKAKQQELSAGVDAYKANVAVDEQTTQALSGISNDSLSAYDNLSRASRLPGGPTGKLATLLGIFDSDFNAHVQEYKLQANQMRATQITQTAAVLKEKNNALPTILGKVTEAEQAMFNAQRDVNTLAIQSGTLADQQLRTRIDGVRLGIEQSQEQRKRIMFPIEEKQAELALHNLQNATLKGDRDEFNDAGATFVSHLPTDFVTQKLQAAQQSGNPMVDFVVGKDKTGKPITQSLPFDVVNNGLLRSADLEQKANAYVAADIVQKTQLIPKIQGIVTTARAMADLDPRMGQIINQTAGAAQALDPKNPNNVRQVATIVDAQNAQLQEAAKQIANKFSTKEAQAAIIHFAQPGVGVFDATGGAAVLGDSVGIPAYNLKGVYRQTTGTLNTLLAEAIKRQGLISGTTFDPTNQTDAAAMIAQLTQKPSGRASIATLTAQILADPANQKVLDHQMRATAYTNVFNGVIAQLKTAKNAPQVWGEIDQHPEMIMSNMPVRDADGNQLKDAKGRPLTAPTLDYQKLFETLEKHTVINGGNYNYSKAFIAAATSYGHAAISGGIDDPRTTLTDRALEGAVHNGNTYGAVLGDFQWNLRHQAELAHQAMAAKIKADLTGQTQQSAANNAYGLQGGAHIQNPTLFGGISSKKTIEEHIANTPSATGTGLTAEQIKNKYPNGY